MAPLRLLCWVGSIFDSLLAFCPYPTIIKLAVYKQPILVLIYFMPLLESTISESLHSAYMWVKNKDICQKLIKNINSKDFVSKNSSTVGFG